MRGVALADVPYIWLKAGVSKRAGEQGAVESVATIFRMLGCLMLMALFALPAEARTLSIVAFGDSLTAGLGLAPGEAYPDRLQEALRAAGHDVSIANAGVSGDTASAAQARVDWSVPEGTDGVILVLGGNDILRGIDPAVTRKALSAILARLQERGIPVLLAGMRAPANLGAEYAKAFDAIYPDLARDYDVVFMPFFLEGVATDPRFNQSDGIHPSEAGVAAIVRNLLPYAAELIERVEKSG